MKNEYVVKGDITVIFVRRRYKQDLEVIVDTQDLGLLMKFKPRWYSAKSKETGSDRIYIKATVGCRPNRTSLYLHRYLTGAPAGLEVDHDNGDTLDNRRINLKVVPHYLNAQNVKPPKGVSEIRGVNFRHQENKWEFTLQVNKTKYRFGLYENYLNVRDAAIEARRFLMKNSKEYKEYGPHPEIDKMSPVEFVEYIKLKYEGSPSVYTQGWNVRRPVCLMCKCSERKHKAKGLCTACYQKMLKSKKIKPC